jgi:hypothetical protein
MTTQQPEALRLADYLTDRNRLDLTCDEAAAELRRLHESNTELVKALEEMLDGEGSSFRVLCEQARAAINKAERTTT